MKTILVTGSSRGIGKATAKLAAERGYRVIVHGRTDSEELQKTHREIKGSEKVFFDVTNPEAVRAALETVDGVDILVNNAGVGDTGNSSVDDVDDTRALDEYRVSVLGTIHCVSAVLPYMLKQTWQSSGPLERSKELKRKHLLVGLRSPMKLRAQFYT